MKICLLMTGVIRPTIDRVYNNILNSLNILKQTNNEIYIKIFPYRDSYEKELINKIKSISIDYDFIDPINRQLSDEFNFTEEEKLCFVNSYRMTKSIEISSSLVDNFFDFDAIIRHRLDYEIKRIELPESIEDNTYYSAEYAGGIFDNFGVSSPTVFKKIWDHKKLEEQFNKKNFINNETLLKNRITSQGIKTQTIKFEVHGYQSSDKYWNDIPQWSRQDRKFSF